MILFVRNVQNEQSTETDRRGMVAMFVLLCVWPICWYSITTVLYSCIFWNPESLWISEALALGNLKFQIKQEGWDTKEHSTKLKDLESGFSFEKRQGQKVVLIILVQKSFYILEYLLFVLYRPKVKKKTKFQNLNTPVLLYQMHAFKI